MAYPARTGVGYRVNKPDGTYEYQYFEPISTAPREIPITELMGGEALYTGRGTIPLKGHLEPLLFGGGITQDEIARQPVSQTNFDGRSEARDISLIRGNTRQSCARPSVPLKIY